MSEKSFYLDKEGLNQVVSKIKEKYATKKALADQEVLLKDLISQEVIRAGSKETELSSAIDGVESKLNREIGISREAEQNLVEADQDLQNQINELENSKVSGVIVNGQDVVDDNNIANIQIDEFIDASIKVVDELPEIGENNRLYITTSDYLIYQWMGNQYREVGKLAVSFIDVLPPVGEPGVLYVKIENVDNQVSPVIYVYVENPIPGEFGSWAELSSQDKELRATFAVHTHPIDKIEGIDSLWVNILKNTPNYAPSNHTHDDRYYTQEQVNEKIHDSGISREEFDDHINSENPHPNLKLFIEDLISRKADLSTLGEHINNSDNPHRVTKDQIGLNNVSNLAPEDLPVSNATQQALNAKADTALVEEELLGKVSVLDVIDNLITLQPQKPLSAKQGVVLDEKITILNSRVQSLGAALTFKGTVPSVEALSNIENPAKGDSYQINSGEESEDDGAMYAWDGVNWVEIVASATDLTSLIATDAEVHSIIDEYEQ